MGDKNTISLLSSINGFLKAMVDGTKQNSSPKGPKEIEKVAVKKSEKNIKDLGTSGSIKASLKTAKGPKGQLSGVDFSTVGSAIQSLQDLPVLMKMISKIKDKDVDKFEKIMTSFTRVLDTLGKDDKAEKGAKNLVKILNSLKDIQKVNALKIAMNLKILTVMKVDKMFDKFIKGLAKAFKSAGKITKDQERKMKTAVKAIKSLNSVVIASLLIIAGVGMMAALIKKFGVIEIMRAASITAAVLLGLVFVTKVLGKVGSKSRRSIMHTKAIIGMILGLQLIIASSVLIGMLAQKHMKEMMTGLGITMGVLLAFVAVITLASFIAKFSKTGIADFVAIAKIAAGAIGLVLATMLVGVITKLAWKQLLFGFAAVAGVILGYVFVITLAGFVAKMQKAALADFIAIGMIAAGGIGLVLATMMIGAIVTIENGKGMELVAKGFIIVAGVILGYSIIGRMAAAVAKGSANAAKDLLAIGMIAGAGILLVLGTAAIPWAMKKMGVDWLDLAAAYIAVAAVIGGCILVMKALGKIQNSAQIKQAEINLLIMVGLIAACEAVIFAAIKIGQEAKKDPGAAALGVAALGTCLGIIWVLNKIMLTMIGGGAARAAVVNLGLMVLILAACEGVIGGAILLGKMMKDDPDAVKWGAGALTAALTMVGILAGILKAVGKMKSAENKAIKQLALLTGVALMCLGIVGGAILVGKLLQDKDSATQALEALGLTGLIMVALIGLAFAAGKIKGIEKGAKTLKDLVLVAAAAEALILGAILLVKVKQKAGVKDEEVNEVLYTVAGIVGGLLLLAIIAGAANKLLDKGTKNLYKVVGIAAVALLIITGSVLLVKFMKDSGIEFEDIFIMLGAMGTVVGGFGALCALAGIPPIAAAIATGAAALLAVCGIAAAAGVLLFGIIHLGKMTKELGGEQGVDAGFDIINKTLKMMGTVITQFGELCLEASIQMPLLIAGAVGLYTVAATAGKIATTMGIITRAAEDVKKLKTQDIQKVIDLFNSTADSMYDMVGIKFIGKAAVITANLPAVDVISDAAQIISKAMSDMAGVCNDKGQMRSMQVAGDKIVYGEWSDPIKASEVISTSMSTFADKLYQTFSKMNDDGLEMTKKGSDAMAKIIGPVSNFAKALMAFQEAGDGKIRELKYDENGKLVDTPAIDVKSVATSIAGAVSNFCSTLFSEDNQKVWQRISSGSITTKTKDANGNDVTTTSSSSAVDAMGALGTVIDPICNFAKTLTLFGTSKDNEITIPVYDQNGKLKSERVVNVVQVATKIGEAVSIFLNKLKWSVIGFTNAYMHYGRDKVTKETHGMFSDSKESERYNIMQDSMGCLANIISPIINFVELIAKFGESGNSGKLLLFDDNGKSREIDPGSIATIIASTIETFIKGVAKPFVDQSIKNVINGLKMNQEVLNSVIKNMVDAMTGFKDVDPSNLEAFYKSYEKLLNATINFSSNENKAAAESSIKLITDFTGSFKSLCDQTIIDGLHNLNTEFDDFNKNVDSKVVDALSNISKTLKTGGNDIVTYKNTFNNAASNETDGIVPVNNRVSSSIDKTRVSLTRFDTVLKNGNRARITYINSMAGALVRLRNETNSAEYALRLISYAIKQVNELCNLTSRGNVDKALDAFQTLGEAISAAAQVNGPVGGGDGTMNENVNNADNGSRAGRPIEHSIKEALNGATLCKQQNNDYRLRISY